MSPTFPRPTRAALAALSLAALSLAACAPDAPLAPRTAAPRGPALHAVADGPRPSLPALASGAAGGSADVIWHRLGTGDFGVWHMNGATPVDGAAGGWVPFAVSSGWKIEAVADFDGDGHTDLLFHQTGTTNFGFWLMQGATRRGDAGSWVPLEASAGWEVADAARIDGDASADLLFRNPSTGENGVWLMSGTTPKPEPGGWVPLPASAGWHVDAALDVGSYGRGVLWHRTGSGDFGLWRMDGTTPGSAPSDWTPVSASAGWEVVDAADFDGDGHSDLLVRGPTAGEYGILGLSWGAPPGPASATATWMPLSGSGGWVPVVAGDFGAP
jgi:hypothetical protein